MTAAARAAQRVRPVRSTDDVVLIAVVALGGLFLAVALAAPLGALLAKSFQDEAGRFVGLANYIRYVETPALLGSLWNSLWVAALTTAIVLPLAFGYAYALTRSAMPGKAFFRAIALLPILAPSLLPALALIYLFGNQGMLKPLLMGGTIYGPAGIIVSEVFYCFPPAVLILATALSGADARLYEAAEALRASRIRVMRTVTLPAARYGMVSAGFVVFTLVITDFGIPKVIGGSFNVLATDVYKQVVGQQNFQMGAVVGMVLLAPAVLAYLADGWARRRQTSSVSARAVPYVAKRRPKRDGPLLLHCAVIAALMLGLIGVAAWGSLITFWPWNLSLTLANYEFGRFDSAGWGSWWNSVTLAAWTAAIGAPLVFVFAYGMEKAKTVPALAGIVRFAATVPLAVPGLVLGIAYIFYFNAPANPAGFLYGTTGILVLNSIVHFYTVGHLASVTALKQLDPEFESVAASLKVPVWRSFLAVTVPISLPVILDVAIYLFVNAMTTVSAVVFLYAPDTKPASVALVQMDEAGQASAAAAMAITILATSAAVKALHVWTDGVIARRTQAWRSR
ncbi:putative 2-aminoethylphosphonate ABC transporter permease subunit [Elioraea rosea]|uniref:putative 2-aminoethylphosphonate ABC transporter permease subunit n=1 Tax=Elioraea rosea TaxID=2492390 RepID=UPI001186871A|nr:putative 2-aminoethylphosphonate ABC transporter permease subunit [Elioraea rosea]